MSFFPETRLESVLVPSFPGVTELFGFATLATERHSRAKPSRTKVGLAGGDDGAEHELALLHAETGSRRLSFAKDGLCCSRPCYAVGDVREAGRLCSSSSRELGVDCWWVGEQNPEEEEEALS